MFRRNSGRNFESTVHGLVQLKTCQRRVDSPNVPLDHFARVAHCEAKSWSHCTHCAVRHGCGRDARQQRRQLKTFGNR